MYAPDFYVKENIIGFTGNLYSNPTVYFQNNIAYGHITQSHSNPNNIGRELVNYSHRYTIGNTGMGGTSEEKIGAIVFHPSRTRFVSRRHLTMAIIEELAKAIEQFPNRKRRTVRVNDQGPGRGVEYNKLENGIWEYLGVQGE